jgi:UDP-N-acetylglucosamine 2-epimerase (non-hydrolysing)
VREVIGPLLAGLDNVRVIEPLDYGGFSRLMQRSSVVLTDSGGVQEEAPSLGKPDEQTIVDAVSELFADPSAYARMANAVNPYGDGRAAARSVEAIAHELGLGPAPQPFVPGAG